MQGQGLGRRGMVRAAAGGRREAGGGRAGRQDVRGTGRPRRPPRWCPLARCSLLPTPAARPQLRPDAAVHLAYGGTAPAPRPFPAPSLRRRSWTPLKGPARPVPEPAGTAGPGDKVC